jgi:hypothetical protein
VIGLLAVTGMRISEALGLDCADVDLDAGVLTVRNSQFRKSRQLPVHATTVAALARYERRLPRRGRRELPTRVSIAGPSADTHHRTVLRWVHSKARRRAASQRCHQRAPTGSVARCGHGSKRPSPERVGRGRDPRAIAPGFSSRTTGTGGVARGGSCQPEPSGSRTRPWTLIAFGTGSRPPTALHHPLINSNQ